ncbi:helix-turn-helix domain-containing protein [Janibacter melonis]|uniref:helix-turn-helix domain-containing protein n=1 Tax=Janibacter melonis TaxID=262209 RepID=UPI002044C758|nr:helix-turn-helix transcriptional regulator [Janibacter melonis]MCM3555906.1 helix-turn-helix domain-containing protein [Janibacter melonis]
MPRHSAPFDGEALRAARESMSLTQHELARRVGVAGGERISLWELGETTPQPATVRRLASVLGLTVSQLVPADEVDLRTLRARAGLTSVELAEAAHVSVSSVRRWETGRVRRRPPERAVQAMADALKVSAQDVEDAIRSASSR